MGRKPIARLAVGKASAGVSIRLAVPAAPLETLRPKAMGQQNALSRKDSTVKRDSGGVTALGSMLL
jgi:hypothetical protein